MPTHSLLIFAVVIDDSFHVDPVLSGFVGSIPGKPITSFGDFCSVNS